jgi:hypothetical protein
MPVTDGPRAAETDDEIRGAEVRARTRDDVLRSIADGALYLPRRAASGALRASGFGVQVTVDGRIVARARDLLRFSDRTGAYPRVALSSESFPALGANIFHRRSTVGAVAGGAYSNDDFWDASAHLSWQRALGSRLLKVTAKAEGSRLDDLVFHGLGAHPRSDPRNAFLPGATEESGRYLQRREALNVVVGLRAGGDLEVFLDALLHERDVHTPPEGDAGPGDLSSVLDPSRADGDSRVLYTEISARWDTRPYAGIVSSGLRAQGYAGYATGMEHDRTRFLRAGGDLAAFVPVLRDNRILMLRGTLDTVDNLRDGVDIPFTEYPRHHTFRGVSSRTILRTDEWVLVPSAAYQWPLGEYLGAQVFVDGLIVARRAQDLSLGGAPWVAGLALEIHTRHYGLGRLVLGGGSEGARIGVDVGGPLANNDRSGWK